MLTTQTAPRHRESGFTLLELTIALAVISVLASGWYQWKQGVLRKSIAQRTADGIVLIEEALYTYRLDERPTPLDPDFPYEWPGSLSDLDPYLPGLAMGRNGVGQRYELIPPSAPVQRTSPIRIRTDMLTEDRARDVARLFPLNGRTTAGDTRVVVIVPVPGHEAAREAILARDGAKDMRGNLDMGNHNIVGVDDEIEIGGQGLNTDDVDLLNQMSALDCPNGVQITGGLAQCAPPPECRVCFSVHRGGGGQCAPEPPAGQPRNWQPGGGWYATEPNPYCSGWSSAVDPAWSPSLKDDTDNRDGWCEYRYRVECR